MTSEATAASRVSRLVTPLLLNLEPKIKAELVFVCEQYARFWYVKSSNDVRSQAQRDQEQVRRVVQRLRDLQEALHKAAELLDEHSVRIAWALKPKLYDITVPTSPQGKRQRELVVHHAAAVRSAATFCDQTVQVLEKQVRQRKKSRPIPLNELKGAELFYSADVVAGTIFTLVRRHPNLRTEAAYQWTARIMSAIEDCRRTTDSIRVAVRRFRRSPKYCDLRNDLKSW